MSEKSKTIEEKMAELRTLAEWFESDEFALEEASEKFETAAKLARDIEHDLSTIENKITTLKKSFEQA